MNINIHIYILVHFSRRISDNRQQENETTPTKSTMRNYLIAFIMKKTQQRQQRCPSPTLKSTTTPTIKRETKTKEGY